MRSLLLAILGVTALCSSAQAHDPLHKVNDEWFSSLRVPTDGLPLNKGASCCNKSDCRPRAFRVIGFNLYEMQADDGSWMKFNSSIFITDPEVRANNPYLQFVGCIYSGVPVCAVMGPAGG